jgi:formylglycine-generating enzyme required for sulfatase activity
MKHLEDIRKLLESLKNEVGSIKNPDSINVLKERVAQIESLLLEKNKLDDSTKFNMTGTVIGDGSIDVAGDIIGGDKIVLVITDLINAEDEQDALTAYLQRLASISDILDLRAIDRQAVDLERDAINLSNVFVHLDVMEKIAYGEDQLGNHYRITKDNIENVDIDIIGQWEMVPMTALEYIDINRKVILVGDSGSGKSIVANYLAYILACFALSRSVNLVEVGLKSFAQEAVIPIKIDVSDYALSAEFDGTVHGLLHYINLTMGSFSPAYKPILRSFNQGRVFVIFDGLSKLENEIAQNVLQSIDDFSNTYPKTRILITSRSALHESIGGTMNYFATTKLSPLSVDQIIYFIQRWYSEARARHWSIQENREKELISAIRRPDLFELAKNPLLLTQIVLLHSSYGKLPENKISLYDEVGKLLLQRWESHSTGFSILEYLGYPSLGMETLEMALAEIAFISFDSRGTLPMPKSEILELLQKYLDGDWGKAQKFCEFIEKRAGLLVLNTNGKYSFLHDNFQEYLVAKYLAYQNDFVSKTVDLLQNNPDKWKNIYVLAVRIAGADRGVMAINALCYDDPVDITQSSNVENKKYELAIIAAESIVELGVSLLNQRPERLSTLKRVKKWLEVIVLLGLLDIRDRVKAGNLLGILGDSRNGVLSLEPDLIFIPKGKVRLNPPKGIMGVSDVQPYDFDVDYDYWVSRYPVTQAQYILFIKENPDYHVPEGNPSYDWDKETRMPKSDKLNHPVVMISWHDARTYCNWLNSKLVNKGLIPDGYEVRLPTEVEWEKAMHGGIIINNSVNSFPNRLFPWGNEPLKDHGNLPNIEPILSETTPVGVYPSGKSPYNILDMAGNAMEWVQTSWGSTDINRPGFDLLYNPNDGRNSNSVSGYRILRGGSWLFAESGAQCSCRLDENVRYADVGMRIIVGPKL